MRGVFLQPTPKHHNVCPYCNDDDITMEERAEEDNDDTKILEEEEVSIKCHFTDQERLKVNFLFKICMQVLWQQQAHCTDYLQEVDIRRHGIVPQHSLSSSPAKQSLLR